MDPIVIATGNPHKVRELREIFAEGGIPVVGLADLPGGPFPEPEEHGSTFEENAALKAVAYARLTGRLCLADDSGLEVDALGGRPGVASAYYSSGGRDIGLPRAERDAANNALLIRELAGIPQERRTARYVCVMALASPGADGRVIRTTRGTFEGQIGLEPAVPRGSSGFGYDPFFLAAPEFAQTAAELAPEEKNRRSHRGQAARRMAIALAIHAE